MINYLAPKSILALTATAGKPVIGDICRTLRMIDHHGDSSIASMSNSKNNSVKVLSCNRDNIDVTAVFLQNEDEKLPMVSEILLLRY